MRTDELQNNYIQNVAKNPDNPFPPFMGIFTQVGPPFLHIFMGLFKYLEEQLMKEVEAIDNVTIDSKERARLIQSIQM